MSYFIKIFMNLFLYIISNSGLDFNIIFKRVCLIIVKTSKLVLHLPFHIRSVMSDKEETSHMYFVHIGNRTVQRYSTFLLSTHFPYSQRI